MTGLKFVLIGRFLGAGKTTAIRRYAGWLKSRGMEVAVITNDQGQGLIDSRTMENEGILPIRILPSAPRPVSPCPPSPQTSGARRSLRQAEDFPLPARSPGGSSGDCF